MTTTDAHGPIDFVLIEFAADALSGAAQLAELVERGTIRLYDLVVVRKDDAGNLTRIPLDDPDARVLGGYDAFAGAQSGLLGDEDLATAAEALAANTLAALVVYENAWAIPFVAAALDGGGNLVASVRIPAQDVMATLDELDASS